MDEDRLKHLEDNNEGTVFPHKVTRELCAEIRYLQGQAAARQKQTDSFYEEVGKLRAELNTKTRALVECEADNAKFLKQKIEQLEADSQIVRDQREKLLERERYLDGRVLALRNALDWALPLLACLQGHIGTDGRERLKGYMTLTLDTVVKQPQCGSYLRSYTDHLPERCSRDMGHDGPCAPTRDCLGERKP